MGLFKTISNRTSKLGYIEDFGAALDYIAKEYASLETEQEQYEFARKIAGGLHLTNFVKIMGTIYPFDQKVHFNDQVVLDKDLKKVNIKIGESTSKKSPLN